MAEPVVNLRAPGPGYRLLRFSDGTHAWMPPEATIDDWQEAKDQGEAARNQKYMAQAQAEGRPITTQDMVYSATAARPNNLHGHLMAWIDHNLGGNALNANPTAQRVNAYAAPAAGVVSRVGTAGVEMNPAVRTIDLGVTGYNIAKHLAGKFYPQINEIPDSQTILGLVRKAAGTPELDPSAPAAQRIAENTASMMLNPSSWTKNALIENSLRSGSSYVGGEAGQAVAGEPGQFVGSFIGASPESGASLARKLSAPAFRGKTTKEVSDAANRQGIQPTAGAVSNNMGRLVDKVIASTPLVGTPVRTAQERFNEAIRQRQLGVAEDVFGQPLPGDIGKEDIGTSLIAGARQGAANITQRASDEQNQLKADIGPNTPVNARGVYRGPAGYEAQRLQMDPNTYPAYAARLDNLRQAAVEAQHPFFKSFWGSLAAGEVPYARFQELRSNIGASLQGYSGLSKGQQDQLYEAMTGAMRDAAFQRGGQQLADQFDAANANYKALIGAGGRREALEAVGGKPQSGGWGQFAGPGGQAGTTAGADFTGGKGAGEAYNWLNSNLRSPERIAPFADPSIVPNDFWREVVGQWLATRGQTDEGTYRPDLMAKQWSGPQTGVGGDVREQLMTGPSGQPTASVPDMNDVATLGRNAVVPINRSGLTDTASSVFAWKYLLDQLKNVGGGAGMLFGGRQLANAWANPEWANEIRGQGTPLVDSLYSGIPAGTQTVMQSQLNPPAEYDPLGWGLTARPPSQ